MDEAQQNMSRHPLRIVASSPWPEFHRQRELKAAEQRRLADVAKAKAKACAEEAKKLSRAARDHTEMAAWLESAYWRKKCG